MHRNIMHYVSRHRQEVVITIEGLWLHAISLMILPHPSQIIGI